MYAQVSALTSEWIMISLLKEKEYEMLGDIEIHQADWARIREMGSARFISRSCFASFSGRFGIAVLLSVVGVYSRTHWLSGTLFCGLALGIWSLGLSASYAALAWRRIERRFAP